MTDAEKFVRETCPYASIAGPMRNSKPHSDGGYMLFASPICSGPLACGKTVIEAWANAANKLVERSPVVK